MAKKRGKLFHSLSSESVTAVSNEGLIFTAKRWMDEKRG